MKISLEWLNEFAATDGSGSRLAEALTMAGIEVEGVLTTGVDIGQVVVAEILSSARHPNADRLSVCKVAAGGAPLQIVCGAKNYKVGDRVPLALPGAVLPNGLTIKESKLRGELSQGMMCSGRELGLDADAEGLLILPPDAELGRPIRDLFPPDTVFDVEVTPNRPDLLSHRGVARELVAMGAAVWREGKAPAPGLGKAAAAPGKLKAYPVTVEDADACPCYTATLVGGVTAGPSPAWMRRRLEAVGLRTINSLVDITNYVLLECGQPLHVFDAAKLAKNGAITVRFAKAGEKIAALDHNEYALETGDLVIADASGPIAVAGVIGGEPTGATGTTNAVVLEAARFRPGTVRRTARRLGLSTDSSYRFERGVDPAGVLAARARALELLAEIAGGAPTASGAAGETEPKPAHVTLRPARVARLLGFEIPGAEIQRGLEALGCRAQGEKDGAVAWAVPSWRPDLEREADLIEEVARLAGLERVPSRLAARPAPSGPADIAAAREAETREALAGFGFFEVVTSPLGKDPDAAAKLANPMTSDQTVLRPSLREHLLAVAAWNLNQGARTLRLFEIGRVFGAGSEEVRLGLLVSGPWGEPHWAGARADLDVYDLKGVLEALGLDAAAAAPVPAAVLKRHDIKQAVAFAEVAAPRAATAPPRFAPWPVHPPVVRDVAVVVPRAIPAAEVEAAIRKAGAAHFEETALFDVFTDDSGGKLPADRKSLAFSVRYRARDRTLTDAEVNAAHETLRAALAKALGCAFR